MIACKHIPLQRFDIKHPRYYDKRVLLKASKVRDNNKVVFTDAPSMGEQPYYISGRTIKKFKKENNGVIDVYSVPLEELTTLQYKDRCEHEW